MFHCCLICRKHNRLLNNSWFESSFASVWVFAHLECSSRPLSTAAQIQLAVFSGCSLVFLLLERSTLLITRSAKHFLSGIFVCKRLLFTHYDFIITHQIWQLCFLFIVLSRLRLKYFFMICHLLTRWLIVKSIKWPMLCRFPHPRIKCFYAANNKKYLTDKPGAWVGVCFVLVNWLIDWLINGLITLTLLSENY